jgi:hypothetical protein
MKRLLLSITVLAALGAGIASADPVRVDDPVGVFTDSSGNAGYVEVDDAGAVRACNENEATPLGDDFTGYIWVNPSGEDTTPTYGNNQVGAGDEDGTAGGNDCP